MGHHPMLVSVRCHMSQHVSCITSCSHICSSYRRTHHATHPVCHDQSDPQVCSGGHWNPRPYQRGGLVFLVWNKQTIASCFRWLKRGGLSLSICLFIILNYFFSKHIYVKKKIIEWIQFQGVSHTESKTSLHSMVLHEFGDKRRTPLLVYEIASRSQFKKP